MIFRPVPLTAEAKAKMQPAIDRGSNVTWPQVERWLADGCACVWQINGGQAYVLTLASEGEIEGVLAGGTGAREWARDFGKAMLRHPLHKGCSLSITGRKGWKRILSDWSIVKTGEDYELGLEA